MSQNFLRFEKFQFFEREKIAKKKSRGEKRKFKKFVIVETTLLIWLGFLFL